MSRTEPRQYRVLDVIGRGGFGTVYRAELRLPEGFVKDVALKVPNTTEADPRLLARLRDEARMLGLVHHRAIVGVDALVKVFDRWTVVMEFVDGTSLLALLRHHGPLPVTIALQIVEEVASGLHAAYVATDREGRQLRLLHRDVKPSNVQLTRFGEVKLLDFGVARGELTGPTRESVTSGSVVYGSVPYLAPERLDLEDGHASDVFALVLTLAQLVTGRSPEGPCTDPQKHAAQLDRWRAALTESGAPLALIDWVARGLAWEPTDRPDATELIRGSRAIRGTLPDIPLSEWAAEHVVAVQQATPPVAGEYTGRWVAEAPTT
ncbi:MAG: serine/threonine-protein kinase, partial [Myxococcota bacterium]